MWISFQKLLVMQRNKSIHICKSWNLETFSVKRVITYGCYFWVVTLQFYAELLESKPTGVTALDCSVMHLPFRMLEWSVLLSASPLPQDLCFKDSFPQYWKVFLEKSWIDITVCSLLSAKVTLLLLQPGTTVVTAFYEWRPMFTVECQSFCSIYSILLT